MNKNIINNAQLLEIKTKIRQLGAMMNAYQCRFVVSSGQLFFLWMMNMLERLNRLILIMENLTYHSLHVTMD